MSTDCDSRYSLPSQRVMKSGNSLYVEKTNIDAINNRSDKSSQKILVTLSVFPSAIKLPTPALVLFNRLLIKLDNLSVKIV